MISDLVCCLVVPFVSCRKSKPKKNNTKAWFPKEVSAPNKNTNTAEVILQESLGVVTRR